ncbi:MAG: hypothetical protein M3R64_03650 [Pseudomonadota bacterium]|nr:hypothetical protein [Pseudomonadota bacterium]
MRGIILTMAVLALSACGSNDAGGNNSSDAESTGAMSQPAVPATLQLDKGEQVVPIATPSPSPISSIPAAFQGRWGMVPEDCNPKRADNKGLMTVAADRLTFYESRATIGSLHQVTPTKLTGTLDYTGEGQTWKKATSLTLQDAGKTLVREETDPADASTYSKCPA